METVDVLVLGQHTYKKVSTFGEWPYGSKPVILLSSTLVHIPVRLAASVECMACPPGELVRRLAERGARHLYVDGGETIQGFFEAGFIRPLIITRIPILIGRDIPLLGPLTHDIKLQHIETRSSKRPAAKQVRGSQVTTAVFRRLGGTPAHSLSG